MVLEGDGVRLRPWRVDDAATVRAVAADPIVRRWSRIARMDAEAWIAGQGVAEDAVSLAIAEPASDVAVGSVALRMRDAGAGVAELSYWLVPGQRGRGLVTAACRLLCGWGFERMGIATVVLSIDVDNEPSKHVARALGAVADGRPARHEVDQDGVRRAVVAYALAPA